MERLKINGLYGTARASAPADSGLKSYRTNSRNGRTHRKRLKLLPVSTHRVIDVWYGN